MKLNFIKKPCPTCKTEIGTNLLPNRDEIIRCQKCGELLVENPKKILFGSIIMIAGVLLGIGGPNWFGVNLFWGLGLLLIFFLASIMIRNLIVIKKDLIIRNKQTNKISYIDNTDWSEILKNLSDRENTFEIIEKLG